MALLGSVGTYVNILLKWELLTPNFASFAHPAFTLWLKSESDCASQKSNHFPFTINHFLLVKMTLSGGAMGFIAPPFTLASFSTAYIFLIHFFSRFSQNSPSYFLIATGICITFPSIYVPPKTYMAGPLAFHQKCILTKTIVYP
jgi:hypothetical protein